MLSPPDREECIGERMTFHDPGGQDVGHPPAHIPSTSDTSHSPSLRGRSLTEISCFYDFDRANARIGTNRSSAGIRNMVCASARYRASN